MTPHLYKLMYVPHTEGMFWNMQTEQPADAALHNVFMQLLNQQTDVKKWCADYEQLYKQWLDNDDTSIYNLQQPLLQTMLQAIQAVNKQLTTERLFFWFDVDRSQNEAFEWTQCPLTHEPLIDLGKSYFYTNRLVSLTSNIVVPYTKNTNELAHAA